MNTGKRTRESPTVTSHVKLQRPKLRPATRSTLAPGSRIIRLLISLYDTFYSMHWVNKQDLQSRGVPLTGVGRMLTAQLRNHTHVKSTAGCLQLGNSQIAGR